MFTKQKTNFSWENDKTEGSISLGAGDTDKLKGRQDFYITGKIKYHSIIDLLPWVHRDKEIEKDIEEDINQSDFEQYINKEDN